MDQIASEQSHSNDMSLKEPNFNQPASDIALKIQNTLNTLEVKYLY